jgi:hypothetical protein
MEARDDDDTLVTASEAARFFNPPLTPARVRQLVDRGQLSARRTPSGWRLIPLSEVRRLVEKRRGESVGAA